MKILGDMMVMEQNKSKIEALTVEVEQKALLSDFKKVQVIIEDLKASGYFTKKEHEKLKKEKEQTDQKQAETNKDLADQMRMFKVKIRESTMGVEKLQKEFSEKMQGGMFGFGMGSDKVPVDEEFAAEIRGDLRKLTKDLKQLSLEMKDEKLRVDKEFKTKFDLSELEAIERGILDKSED